MKKFDVKLYSGWPETSGDTLEEMVEKGLLVPLLPKENGLYDLCPGVYSGHITGEDVYPTLKVFSVKEMITDAEGAALMRDFVVHIIKEEGRPAGYQPAVVAADAPEFFKRTQKDELLCIWPDDILKLYADAAVPDHHQWMSQQALEQRIASLKNPYLSWYVLGTSDHYGFTIPMAVLSKTDLSGCSREDAPAALAALRENGKVNIFYQAQIHGNEPAACDGALEVIAAFCQEGKLQELLDHVNLVVIPRANPEAAYLYRRMAYNNIDLNRDHMACQASETRLLHQAFQILEPEVVLDGHEFTFFVAETEDGRGYVAKGCEIMTSPATSLNIDGSVRDCSYSLCGQVFKDLQEMGHGVFHFGTAEQPSFGRGFYGLHQCLAFLVETRGIGGGRYGAAKRIQVQKDTMLAYIKTAAACSREMKEIVRKARSVCSSNDLVLHHGSSETAETPYKGVSMQYYLDGALRKKTEAGMLLKDLALRVRKPAKAYVLPADLEHIEAILTKVKGLGCLAEKLDPGTGIKAEQYRCNGLLREDGHEKDIQAELLPASEIVFENGAYRFTAKDYRMVLLAMLMEPDVTDTVGTKGTLFQQGLLDYDGETGLFPLYRTDEL